MICWPSAPVRLRCYASTAWPIWLMMLTVTLAPGSVVINFGAGASASDRAAVRKEVESALKDAVDALAKEINRS